ncbi:hypothetical protein Dimus_038141 [Dionaea muscipula]
MTILAFVKEMTRQQGPLHLLLAGSFMSCCCYYMIRRQKNRDRERREGPRERDRRKPWERERLYVWLVYLDLTRLKGVPSGLHPAARYESTSGFDDFIINERIKSLDI